MRLTDVVLAFPGFVLALILVAVTGNSIPNVVIAVIVAYIPYFIRLTRAEALAQREMEYVDGARLAGNPPVALSHFATYSQLAATVAGPGHARRRMGDPDGGRTCLPRRGNPTAHIGVGRHGGRRCARHHHGSVVDGPVPRRPDRPCGDGVPLHRRRVRETL